jgi:hypothetical protein
MMKRLVFAFAVLALVACAKQEAVPAADTTAVAPAAAPADTMAPAAAADTTKMGGAKKE